MHACIQTYIFIYIDYSKSLPSYAYAATQDICSFSRWEICSVYPSSRLQMLESSIWDAANWLVSDRCLGGARSHPLPSQYPYNGTVSHRYEPELGRYSQIVRTISFDRMTTMLRIWSSCTPPQQHSRYEDVEYVNWIILYGIQIGLTETAITASMTIEGMAGHFECLLEMLLNFVYLTKYALISSMMRRTSTRISDLSWFMSGIYMKRIRKLSGLYEKAPTNGRLSRP